MLLFTFTNTYYKIKKLQRYRKLFGGVERIRTAVRAFAEPGLATRPRRLNY